MMMRVLVLKKNFIWFDIINNYVINHDLDQNKGC